jgi:hypothetical protein
VRGLDLLTNRTFIGFVITLVALGGGGCLLVMTPQHADFVKQTWTALFFGTSGWFLAKNGNGNGSYTNGSGNGAKA